jgi:hypothetical protein
MPLSCVMRGYTRTVYARSSDEAFAPVVSIMNACAIVLTIFEMPKPLRTSVVDALYGHGAIPNLSPLRANADIGESN